MSAADILQTVGPDSRPGQTPSHHGGWGDLPDRLRQRAAEAIDLISILLQDAVILLAGFLAEFASDKWFHSSHTFFQLATNLSSAVFLLLYGVTVSVHVVHYVRGQVGSAEAGVLGRYLPWLVAGAAVIAAAVFATVPGLGSATEMAGHEPASGKSVVRFSIGAPAGATFLPELSGSPWPALSPDGRHLAYVAWSGAKGGLWVRSFDAEAAQRLADAEIGATFWSPDSENVGFVSQSKLMQIGVRSGSARSICDLLATFAGGTWNRQGTILFGVAAGPLLKVAASGGEPVPATTIESSRGETGHGYPFFLPDQRHYLFTVRSTNAANEGIAVGSLDGGTPRLLIAGVTSAVKYSPAGYLLFVRNRTLMAQPFDAERLALTGAASTVAPDVNESSGGGTAVAVSGDGTLVYRTSSVLRSKLAWFDRTGKALGDATEPGEYANLALSPDGSKVAFDTGLKGRGDIWVHDLSKKVTSRLTFDDANTVGPVWTPDGTSIVFRSSKVTGRVSLYRVGVGTVGEKELLLETPVNVYADSISPDGRMLVYVHTGYNRANDSNRHVFALPLAGDRKPVQMTEGQFIESFPKISPDGRWLSYASNGTGRDEIQIQSFPTPRVRMQVSTTGGTEAIWSADGRELFYLTFEGKLMSVPIKATADGLQAGAPVALFTPPLFSSPGGSQQFAVTRDGRFLVNVPTEGAPLTLSVVLNWPSSMHEPTASR